VLINGAHVEGPGADRGVVFQKHALMPWLSVIDNVCLGLRMRGVGASERRRIGEEKLGLVGLEKYADRAVYELSGGMQQRVGIARAFAIQPKMLLLDEPFGALDALTRGNIQDELVTIVRQTKQTIFMITHDVDEAILLSDKIFLMSNGPRAKLAEIVTNPLPRDRTRATMHHDPKFYEVRNHLIDFLVHRSKTFAAA
jgi:nitrate/nitrite transport system ATP-binding protein